jgi:hypothetical protein
MQLKVGHRVEQLKSILDRSRERRERKRRDRAERVARRARAHSGPDRTGRGDQWMGPGGG